MPLIDPYDHDFGTPPPTPWAYIIFTILVFLFIVGLAVLM